MEKPDMDARYVSMYGAMSMAMALLLCLCGCNFTYKIKSGEEAYNVKQYAVAVEMLSTEYSQASSRESRAQKAFLLGLSHEHVSNPEQAAHWFRQAYDDNFGIVALEKYADNLKRLEQYGEAAEIYNQLMQTESQSLKYRQLFTACRQAAEWLDQEPSSPYHIETQPFNTPASEYSPYVLGPDMVIFTSDRATGSNSDTYNWTGRAFSDIYVVNTQTNAVQPFDPVTNSEYNDGTIAFNSNKTEMIFTRCFNDDGYDMYCKLMACYRRGASWSEPEVLPFTKDDVNYAHPTFANDSLLVFAANDPEGMGGFDLYYVQWQGREWGTPALMSDRINTIGNEKFPFMYHDTLYFSSDNHVGMGGYDIFRSYLRTDGNWTPAYNLKPPVNSGWDDFAFVVDTFAEIRGNVLERGFFSSSRRGGSGADDIYGYTKSVSVQTPPTETIVDTSTGKKVNYQAFLAIKVVEPVFADPEDPNSERVGKRPLSGARVAVGDGADMRGFRTEKDGYVLLELEFEKLYDIRAQFRGFFARQAEFSTVDLEKDPDNPVRTYNIELLLEPIFKGKEIVLRNIYYDYDEWFIRDDAKPSLDTLAMILKDNPQISIQLGSHTDCRGEIDYNTDLSQKRAQSAVDYLISKGIDEGRLMAFGYGESKPEIACDCERCTEAEHQENRRTTFTVLQ